MAVESQFSTVFKVLYLQVLVAVLVALGFMLMGGWKYALSPFLGSSVAILPNLYFAYRNYLVRHRQVQDIVKGFYAGEAVKLLLTAGLFVAVLQIPTVDFKTLLIGYAATLSVFWFALILWRD